MKKPPAKRNPMAKALANPQYRPRDQAGQAPLALFRAAAVFALARAGSRLDRGAEKNLGREVVFSVS